MRTRAPRWFLSLSLHLAFALAPGTAARAEPPASVLLRTPSIGLAPLEAAPLNTHIELQAQLGALLGAPDGAQKTLSVLALEGQIALGAVELGVHLPLLLREGSTSTMGPSTAAFAIGNLRLHAKVRLWQRSSGWRRFAVMTYVNATLPTMSGYSGSRAFGTLHGGACTVSQLGRLSLGACLGALVLLDQRAASSSSIGFWTLDVGGGFRLHRRVGVVFATQLAIRLAGGGDGAAAYPVRVGWTAGLRLVPIDGLTVFAGARSDSLQRLAIDGATSVSGVVTLGWRL